MTLLFFLQSQQRVNNADISKFWKTIESLPPSLSIKQESVDSPSEEDEEEEIGDPVESALEEAVQSNLSKYIIDGIDILEYIQQPDAKKNPFLNLSVIDLTISHQLFFPKGIWDAMRNDIKASLRSLRDLALKNGITDALDFLIKVICLYFKEKMFTY